MSAMLRSSEAGRAEQIVDHAVGQFALQMQAREVAAIIVGLRNALERVRREEIERHRKHFVKLARSQQDALDRITRSMVDEILHCPIARLEEMARLSGVSHEIELVRRIFNLGDP